MPKLQPSLLQLSKCWSTFTTSHFVTTKSLALFWAELQLSNQDCYDTADMYHRMSDVYVEANIQSLEVYICYVLGLNLWSSAVRECKCSRKDILIFGGRSDYRPYRPRGLATWAIFGHSSVRNTKLFQACFQKHLLVLLIKFQTLQLLEL